MTDLNIHNFILFISIAWGANIMLNLVYVLKKYVPGSISFDAPLDMGVIFFDHQRLFGDSTTFLGIIASIFFTVVVCLTGLYPKAVAVSVPFLVYAGHMTGSFIKRRLRVADGKYIPLLDHGDYIILSGGVLYATGNITLALWLSALTFTYIFHPLACLVAYKLKLKENPY